MWVAEGKTCPYLHPGSRHRRPAFRPPASPESHPRKPFRRQSGTHGPLKRGQSPLPLGTGLDGGSGSARGPRLCPGVVGEMQPCPSFGHGFTVIDLGVDVPAEKFVEEVLKNGAKVLGLSALLNSTYPEMKKVVDAVAAAGIREGVSIIIGGTICSDTVRQYTGADYYANDAITGIKICGSAYGYTDA